MSLFEQKTKENEKKDNRKLKKLTDAVWKVRAIKEQWDKNGGNTRNWTADTITRKFREMLEALGFKDEIKWYYSESSAGGSGALIFGGEHTPDQMKELFDIFYGNDGLILTVEKNRVADILVNILPVQRNVKQMIELEQDFEGLRQKEKGDEQVTIEEYSFLDNVNISEAHEIRIREIVSEFVPNETSLFLDRIFFKVDTEKVLFKANRQKINDFQYGQIKEWRDKWMSIMDYAAAARIAERFENGYDACNKFNIGEEERKSFYESGNAKSEVLQEAINDSEWIGTEDLCEALFVIYEPNLSKGFQKKEDISQHTERNINNQKTWESWQNECSELVNDVIKNRLKKISKNDFEYMEKCAFQELESIRSKVKREQEKMIYRHEVAGRTEEDMEKLSHIREVIGSKSRTILDALVK